MKISVISFEKYHGRGEGSAGSSQIRAKWLVEKWPDARLWKNGQYADAIIFQKAYWKNMMIDFPGLKILDLCDPDWMGSDLKLVDLSKHVDAITCSNQPIADFVSKVVTDKPVVNVPDRLNLDYFQTKKEHKGKAVRAVYFGYKHNADVVLPQVLPTLGRLGLELLVVSNRPYSAYTSYGTPIKNVKWDNNTAYADIQSGDIAINPPVRSANFRFKSNNKTLVAWGLGLPVANTADELERFLDPAERQKEAIERWAEIQRDWDITLSVKQYQTILANLKEKTP